MAKLGDSETHSAWEDFKKFLLYIGLIETVKNDMQPLEKNHYINKGRIDLAHMAFKQGYVAGIRFEQLEQAKSAATAASVAIVEKVGDPVAEKPRKKYENRQNRSKETRKKDGEAVQEILSQSHLPVPLVEVIRRMRAAGHKHWNNNNASGFMKLAARDGYNVTKVSNGLYSNKTNLFD